jgi:hypothetical protein
MIGIACAGGILCRTMRKRTDAMSGRTNCPSETEEQEGLVNWFRAKFPGVLIFAIPNGGHRAVSTAKRLKAEGVVPGIPDLHVPAWRLWIEMKRAKGGRLSEDQAEMIAHLEGIGHKVIVGKGAEDASAQIVDWIRLFSAQKKAPDRSRGQSEQEATRITRRDGIG